MSQKLQSVNLVDPKVNKSQQEGGRVDSPQTGREGSRKGAWVWHVACGWSTPPLPVGFFPLGNHVLPLAVVGSKAF